MGCGLCVEGALGDVSEGETSREYLTGVEECEGEFHEPEHYNCR